MSSKCKYVRVRFPGKWGPSAEVFIFAETVTHHEFITKMNIPAADVLSAGFVSLSRHPDGVLGIKATPYGEAVSLGIKSDPSNDQYWVNHALGLD